MNRVGSGSYRRKELAAGSFGLMAAGRAWPASSSVSRPSSLYTEESSREKKRLLARAYDHLLGLLAHPLGQQVHGVHAHRLPQEPGVAQLVVALHGFAQSIRIRVLRDFLLQSPDFSLLGGDPVRRLLQHTENRRGQSAEETKRKQTTRKYLSISLSAGSVVI